MSAVLAPILCGTETRQHGVTTQSLFLTQLQRACKIESYVQEIGIINSLSCIHCCVHDFDIRCNMHAAVQFGLCARWSICAAVFSLQFGVLISHCL